MIAGSFSKPSLGKIKTKSTRGWLGRRGKKFHGYMSTNRGLDVPGERSGKKASVGGRRTWGGAGTFFRNTRSEQKNQKAGKQASWNQCVLLAYKYELQLHCPTKLFFWPFSQQYRFVFIVVVVCECEFRGLELKPQQKLMMLYDGASLRSTIIYDAFYFGDLLYEDSTIQGHVRLVTGQWGIDKQFFEQRISRSLGFMPKIKSTISL